jgi:epoxyqueuosine reductase
MAISIHTDDVLQHCRDAGFDLSGVAEAAASNRASQQQQWLADGKHGSMAWMEGHDELRGDVRKLMENAASVICVADRYAKGEADQLQPGHGRIARYARGRDYHVHMKRRLHLICDLLSAACPEHTFRACVDTVPIHERELAEAAGLGSIGKHTLLISQQAGSWVLLGCIVTTLRLEPTRLPGLPSDDPCGTCTRCIDACPTDAITPWSVDARRCISALTIEHREPIDEALHASMGDWLFGCDICQEVCPHNQPTQRRAEAAVDEVWTTPISPGVHGRLEDGSGFDLAKVIAWDASQRQDALQGSSMKRAKLDMFRRNAIIAAANVPKSEAALMRDVCARIASDTDESNMVRYAAKATLARLST